MTKPAPRIPATLSRTMHNADGTMTFARPDGSMVTRRKSGRLSSIRTANGATAKYNSSGKLSSVKVGVHSTDPTHSGEMTIRHGAHGEKTIITTRQDGSRVVSTGARRGYVERADPKRRPLYLQRTYVARGNTYGHVYRGYLYHNVIYYRYVPAFHFAPAFYGWASNPWAVSVEYEWGWGGEAWYSHFGYYFAPSPDYPSADLWLADYVLAEYLQAAYDAQANASAQGAPVPRAPQRGVYAAYRNPAIDAAITHRWWRRSSRRMEFSQI